MTPGGTITLAFFGSFALLCAYGAGCELVRWWHDRGREERIVVLPSGRRLIVNYQRSRPRDLYELGSSNDPLEQLLDLPAYDPETHR